MGEDFVDDDVVERQPVQVAGTLADWEARDVRRAVRQPALRHAERLCAKRHRVKERAAGLRQTDGFAAVRELEVDVVRAVLRRIVRVESAIGIRADADEGELGNEIQHARGRRAERVREPVIGEGDRHGIAVEQFEPVLARRRICHPLVDLHERNVAEILGEVRRAGRGNGQHPVRAARRAADGEIHGLQTERHRVEQSAAGRKQVERVARILESEAGVRRRDGRARRKEDATITARRHHGAGGKNPAARHGHVVREAGVAQVHRSRRRVEKLHPVRRGAVGFLDVRVVGEDFVEADTGG